MFLSIVIATYNRSSYLIESLNFWKKQNFPKEKFEVLVVDNGSKDGTKRVVEDFIRSNEQMNIRYLYLDKPCLACARNEGIKNALGRYVAFVDDDARPQEDYIENFQKHASDYPAFKAFGGKVLPRYETGEEPAWMSPYLMRIFSLVDFGNRVKEFNKKYPVGCNMIFEKSIFEKVGYFDVPAELSRSDDKQFFMKVRRAGEKVLYLPDVVVWHFIDAWRITEKYITETSCKNGYADRVMLELFPDAFWLKLKRFFDLVFKNAAALLLWLKFSLEGKPEKGKFLFLSMWHTFQCFVFKKKKEI